MAGGVVLVALFVAWQRRTTHPLADLALFSSREFTWGTALPTVANFCMFGLLFALPQYYQAVDGADSLQTGLRLLPMIGGLLVGVRLMDRIGRNLTPKVIIAVGYVAVAVGLGLGATTSPHSGYGFIATWLTILGFGIGCAMPTAMSVAVSQLTAERSGAGSALQMAVRQVGGAVGVAVLGTVLNNGYRSHLDGQAPDAVRASVNVGVRVAEALHSPALLANVRAAFTDGMSATLWVSGGISLVAVALAVVFLPGRSATIGGGDTEVVHRTESEVIA
jgi:Na+/melibiose symporter-like transporter